MKCKFTPEDRIAHIYGELNTQQMSAFVRHLESCPQCAADIEGLRSLRRSLPIEEVPPMPRPIKLPAPTSAPPTVLPLHHTTWFRVMTTSAAAILLIMFGAWMTGMSMTVNQGSVTIGFGKTEMPVHPQPVQIDTAPDFNALLAALGLEQEKLIYSLADSLQMRQQAHFDDALASFSRFLDTRRNEDLALISKSLNEIQQINDERFLETNLILSQVINQINRELLTLQAR